MDGEVTVSLDACEPMELLRVVTPEGVWIRMETDRGPSGWPVIAVRGPARSVYDFVSDQWDRDAADAVFEDYPVWVGP